ncbi:hypothetical protein UA08_04808 [Talaromyces atroroseus]|uniref:Cutinase gene palindrome-binding protein n=1 Tax=Talaromyces atroroseus TaxID=1441469 RepID=A0A225AZ44_TALAT|nr:hypothetical protein UA08_04808 [Talaromyces atroroseus]OKL60236.1 hypothetical protein UA08_04808 [Talaromyces atroroseus]
MYLNNAIRSNTAFQGNGVEETFDMDLEPEDLDVLLDDTDDQGIEGMNSADIEINNEDDGSTLQEPEPQPGDLGVQKSVTSAVTDFTRRRNWTQRILAEMRDVLVVLSPDGKVLYSSPATKSITNYEPKDLESRFLSELMHGDDRAAFIREFNESIATGHRLRYHFRFRKPSGEFTILEASGHAHMSREKTTLGTGKEGNRCDGFFLVCRPYPTTNNSLLDSFLEHKVENMRLNRRIADLKKEEEEELRAQQQWVSQSDNSGTLSPDDEIEAHNSAPTAFTDQGMMLPPARPSVSTSGQSGYTSLMTMDSNIDTISRSDTSSVLDGIEMLTGLRYGEGERSRGLSTGERDGALFQEHGDVHHLSFSSEENEKKKRIKTTEEYVCTDCGTLASPEWRKGPSGPKTLCNACGLRWAKKERKRQGSLQSSNQS